MESLLQDLGSHVMVKFFDTRHEIRHLVIEKSLPQDKTILSASALWVQLLEKAYAVYKGGTYAALHTEVGAYQVISLLTGATLEGDCVPPLQMRKKLADLPAVVEGDGIFLFHSLMNMSEDTPLFIRRKICQEVFQEDKKLLAIWEKWLKERAWMWKSVTEKNHPIYLTHLQIFFQTFIDYREKEDAQRQVLASVLKWVQERKILGLPEGDNKYSQEELDFLDQMKKHWEEQKPITLMSAERSTEEILPRCQYVVVGIKNDVISVATVGRKRPPGFSLFGKGKRKEEEGVKVVELRIREFCEAFRHVYSLGEMRLGEEKVSYYRLALK